MANTSILAAFERMWQHITAKIDSKINGYGKEEVDEMLANKSDSNHNHDGVYATEDSVDEVLNEAKSYTDSQTSGLASTSHVTTQISNHNTAPDSHNDIRLLIEGLTTRLNTLANSDDTTLDQMAELVAYIKSNRSLIEEVTTNKINFSDIIDNLTTNVSNKPLSAAQGVALKTLIDAIPDWAKATTKPTYTASEVGLTTETWTFTLEDGSTVTKAVYVG